MKKFFIISLLSALLPSSLYAKDVTIDKFKEVMASENTIILDVRTAEEFNSGHIEGAINIDFYAEDFTDELLKLDRTKSYAIYCRSGNRSGKALKIMRKNGYSNLYNLIGGLESPTNRAVLTVVQ